MFALKRMEHGLKLPYLWELEVLAFTEQHSLHPPPSWLLLLAALSLSPKFSLPRCKVSLTPREMLLSLPGSTAMTSPSIRCSLPSPEGLGRSSDPGHLQCPNDGCIQPKHPNSSSGCGIKTGRCLAYCLAHLLPEPSYGRRSCTHCGWAAPWSRTLCSTLLPALWFGRR